VRHRRSAAYARALPGDRPSPLALRRLLHSRTQLAVVVYIKCYPAPSRLNAPTNAVSICASINAIHSCVFAAKTRVATKKWLPSLQSREEFSDCKEAVARLALSMRSWRILNEKRRLVSPRSVVLGCEVCSSQPT